MRQEHVVRIFTAVLSRDRTATAEVPLCCLGTVQPQPKTVVEFAFYKIMTDLGNIYLLYEISRFRAK